MRRALVRRKQPERSRVWMWRPQDEEANVEKAVVERRVQLWRENDIEEDGEEDFCFFEGGGEEGAVVERTKDFSKQSQNSLLNLSSCKLPDSLAESM